MDISIKQCQGGGTHSFIPSFTRSINLSFQVDISIKQCQGGGTHSFIPSFTRSINLSFQVDISIKQCQGGTPSFLPSLVPAISHSRWISVLNNAKEEVLLKVFQDSSNSPSLNQSVRELTSSIIDRVKRLPGNRACCDCNAAGEGLYHVFGEILCYKIIKQIKIINKQTRDTEREREKKRKEEYFNFELNKRSHCLKVQVLLIICN